MAVISSDIKNVVRKYINMVNESKKISRAFIYGSYARGNASQWSDIDVALISSDFTEDLFEERIVLMKLALTIDDRIEPSLFRPEDFNTGNPLVNEISTFGIEISAE